MSNDQRRREKSQTELLAEISLKLDSVLGFLAASALKEDQGAVVKRLSENGLTVDSIARVAGISENAVNIRLHRIRKKAGGARSRQRKADKVVTNDKPGT